MAGGKVPLTFRIFKGEQLVREERLSLSVIKIGKVPSAHLKLDDETVSRTHAIIEVNGPGDVSIIDLGSTKGTFVNGQKVNKAKLQTGDSIVVGETRITSVDAPPLDRRCRHVERGHRPALCREPERVSALPAPEIRRATGRRPADLVDQHRVGPPAPHGGPLCVQGVPELAHIRHSPSVGHARPPGEYPCRIGNCTIRLRVQYCTM
jgi:hypothetical protein